MYNASNILCRAKDGSSVLPENKRLFYRNIYLNSEHWKALRHEKLAKNPVCEKCQTPYSLDVHHVKYRELYDVRISDLKTLCRLCHKKEHEKINKKKKKQDKNFNKNISIDDRIYEIFHSKCPNFILIKWILDKLLKLRLNKRFLDSRNKKRRQEYKYHHGKLNDMNTYISIHY